MDNKNGIFKIIGYIQLDIFHGQGREDKWFCFGGIPLGDCRQGRTEQGRRGQGRRAGISDAGSKNAGTQTQTSTKLRHAFSHREERFFSDSLLYCTVDSDLNV